MKHSFVSFCFVAFMQVLLDSVCGSSSIQQQKPIASGQPSATMGRTTTGLAAGGGKNNKKDGKKGDEGDDKKDDETDISQCRWPAVQKSGRPVSMENDSYHNAEPECHFVCEGPVCHFCGSDCRNDVWHTDPHLIQKCPVCKNSDCGGLLCPCKHHCKKDISEKGMSGYWRVCFDSQGCPYFEIQK